MEAKLKARAPKWGDGALSYLQDQTKKQRASAEELFNRWIEAKTIDLDTVDTATIETATEGLKNLEAIVMCCSAVHDGF